MKDEKQKHTVCRYIVKDEITTLSLKAYFDGDPKIEDENFIKYLPDITDEEIDFLYNLYKSNSVIKSNLKRIQKEKKYFIFVDDETLKNIKYYDMDWIDFDYIPVSVKFWIPDYTSASIHELLHNCNNVGIEVGKYYDEKLTEDELKIKIKKINKKIKKKKAKVERLKAELQEYYIINNR